MHVDINAHYLTSAYTGTGHKCTRTHDGARGSGVRGSEQEWSFDVGNFLTCSGWSTL